MSPGRIKLVGLTAGPEGPAVTCAVDHALPGGDGARFDAAAVGAEVAALLSRCRVRPRSVAIALGPAEGVARRLVVVEQERAQMLAALSLQLGQALGAGVTAPRVGFAPLAAAAPAGRVAVFAAAARPEAVAAQQRAVAAAGCEQGPVTTAAAALVNAWRACRPQADAAGRTVVLLHVGHTAALWIVLDGGEPAALDAPLVGLAALRDRAGTRAAAADAPALPAAALGEWAGRLRQEIARGLQSVRRESGREDLGAYEVWVSGGGSRVAGFLDALGAALGVPVHAFDPLAALPWQGEPAAVFGPALAPALGAALQALAAAGDGPGGGVLDLDLRASAEDRPTQAGRVPLPVLLRTVARDRGYRGIAAATVVLWAATAFLGARVEEHERAVAEREARVATDSAAVAATLARSQLLEARRRALGDRVDAVAALERGRYAWPRLLHAVSAAVPASAWVSDVLSDGEDPATGHVSFRVRGYAASEAVAGAFARALVADGAASEAEVVRSTTVKIGRTPVVHFELAGRAPAGPEGAAADTPASAGDGR
ncbi:MAG TPA: hypothetical protein VF746_24415 [Longimicrobium sp.]